MKLYYHPLSGHAHRARLLLDLLGLKHELVEVDLMAGAHKTPEFLALNPFGQVPVLVDDDGTAIGNSTAGHIAAVAVSGSGTTGLDQYASTYTLIAYAGFGLGALLPFGAPLVNRLMHGVK